MTCAGNNASIDQALLRSVHRRHDLAEFLTYFRQPRSDLCSWESWAAKGFDVLT